MGESGPLHNRRADRTMNSKVVLDSRYLPGSVAKVNAIYSTYLLAGTGQWESDYLP